jgi:hypothetical protein
MLYPFVFESLRPPNHKLHFIDSLKPFRVRYFEARQYYLANIVTKSSISCRIYKGQRIGTALWMAPEILKGKQPSLESDIVS